MCRRKISRPAFVANGVYLRTWTPCLSNPFLVAEYNYLLCRYVVSAKPHLLLPERCLSAPGVCLSHNNNFS